MKVVYFEGVERIDFVPSGVERDNFKKNRMFSPLYNLDAELISLLFFLFFFSIRMTRMFFASTVVNITYFIDSVLFLLHDCVI